MKALGLTLRRLLLGCRRTGRRRRRPLGLALRSLSLAHRRRMRSHLGSLSLRTLSGGKLVLVLDLREESSSPGHPQSLLTVRADAVAKDATPGAHVMARRTGNSRGSISRTTSRGLVAGPRLS